MERSASLTGKTLRPLLIRRYPSRPGPLCYPSHKSLQAGKQTLTSGLGRRSYIILQPRQPGDCDRMQEARLSCTI